MPKYKEGDKVRLKEFDNGQEIIPAEEGRILQVKEIELGITHSHKEIIYSVEVTRDPEDPMDDRLREMEEDQIEGLVLTEEEREEVIDSIIDRSVAMMFGDGQEEEYLRSGFPEWKPLDQRTDLELLDELGHFDPEVDITLDQKVRAFRKETEQ